MKKNFFVSMIVFLAVFILAVGSALADESQTTIEQPNTESNAIQQPENNPKESQDATPKKEEQEKQEQEKKDVKTDLQSNTNTSVNNQNEQRTAPAQKSDTVKHQSDIEKSVQTTEQTKQPTTNVEDNKKAVDKVPPVEPQEMKIKGVFTPTFQIFFNWHWYNDSESDVNTNAFQLTRTQFGGSYRYGDFLGKFILGVGEGTVLTASGGNSTLAVSGNANWLSFVKRAIIEWKPVDCLKLDVGIIGDEIKTRSEKFAWKHRFINKVLLEQRKFVPSGDQGASITYYFPKGYGNISLSAYAGEGYKKQDTYEGKMYEFATTITPMPSSNLMKGLKLHLGFAYNQMDDDVYKMLAGGILSFEHEYLDVAAEGWWMKFDGADAVASFYSMHKSNFAAAMSYIKQQTSNEMTAIGISVPAAFKYGDHLELFVRYDYYDSLDFSFKDDTGTEHQDYEALLIAGIGWKFNKFFRVALDYWHEWFVMTNTITKDDGSKSLKVDYHQSNTVFLHFQGKY